MTVQWWCAARGMPWTWAWQAYPGVWLFMIAMTATCLVIARAGRASPAALGRGLGVAAGLLLLWGALDWPLGALAAGYLLSAHALQYLLVTGAAVPLVLWGLRSGLEAVVARGGGAPLIAWLGRPLSGAIVFNVVLVATHVPVVVDRLSPSQVGSLIRDLAWMASGVALWWPVIVTVGASHRLTDPARMLYVFLAGLPSQAIGALLTLAPFPLYAVYELAPRVDGVGARADQQLAGLIMWIGMPLVGMLAMTGIFFRWARSSDDEAESVGVRSARLGVDVSRPA